MPSTSFPIAICNGPFLANLSISESNTVCLFLFGTSIPTYVVPGIGAKTLTPGAAKARAISSFNAVILLTLTPAGKSTLKSVTVGPATHPTTLACIPKFAKVFCKLLAVCFNSDLDCLFVVSLLILKD